VGVPASSVFVPIQPVPAAAGAPGRGGTPPPPTSPPPAGSAGS